MVKISLTHAEWQFDKHNPLGKGKFGEVFEGIAQDGSPVAVKRLRSSDDSIDRELSLAQQLHGKDLIHTIPILDFGKDQKTAADYIIMAKAEISLEKQLKFKGSFSEDETRSIMLHIAQGLSENSNIVHRDLKPANVLFHNSVWKVSDFSISRLADVSTAAHTLKGYRTLEYSAPEIWDNQRATHASDVYSLGIIGYELLSGRPPFYGQDWSDFARQHRLEAPPKIPGMNSPLTTFITTRLLSKRPETRPSIEETIEFLSSTTTKITSSRGFETLATASSQLAQEKARQEASNLQQESIQRNRERLAEDAYKQLDELSARIQEVVRNASHDVQYKHDKARGIHSWRLGFATLEISPLRDRDMGGPMPASRWDVVAAAKIFVSQTSEQPYTWGTNLLFASKESPQSYKWTEVGFMMHPFINSHRDEPFALDALRDIDGALGPGMQTIQAATKQRDIFFAIDQFIDEWIERFALAVRGELRRPTSLPLT
jgi:serine/threonine-protein kinase